MLRFLKINLTLFVVLTLVGCNRSTEQPPRVPSTPTGTPLDQVPPAQDANVRVDVDGHDVDVKVDRPGILGDRKIEIHRDAAGNVNIQRETNRDQTDQPLRDHNIDVQVVPGTGVKVDLNK